MPRERLQKALARAGMASRRGSEELISRGRVTVNGRIASLGDRVDPASDEVTVDGHQVPLNPELRYFAINKPVGVVSTLSDPQGRTDLTTLLPKEPRVFPVGRLDYESEGLLLVTNDGELANRITHPRYGVEKEYLAEVEGLPSTKHESKLRAGLDLEDGPARVLRVRAMSSSRGKGALRLVMGEGRKREVRRLLAAVGLPVTRLVRLRVGPINLGQTAPGEVRELSPMEIRALYEAAGL
ncbi:MAG: pseudouridine synthase [Actinomycetota bacterium]